MSGVRVIRARRKSLCLLCDRIIQRGEQAALAWTEYGQTWIHVACQLERADLYVPERLRRTD
jgi:hypothetical protein